MGGQTAAKRNNAGLLAIGGVNGPALFVVAGGIVLSIWGAGLGADAPSPAGANAQPTSNLLTDQPEATPSPANEAAANTTQTTLSHESTTTNAATTTETSVEVNGTEVNVPENTTTHRVIEDETGRTTIDVSNQTSGSSTLVDIHLYSVSSDE